MSTPDPGPWAEGNYGPHADPLPPALSDVLVAFFTTGRPADAAPVICSEADPDAPVPYTLTGQAEVALDAAEPEPEL